MYENDDHRTRDRGMTSERDIFPDSQRVIYDRCPLTQVICQLRFPPLLRIEEKLPADFQERVRNQFPFLQKAVRTQLSGEIPRELAQLLGATALGGAALSGAGYEFHTENRDYKLGLAQDSISLITTKYTRWEEFLNLLRPALAALIEFYDPSFYVRIGLRYQNAIQREAIGLGDHPWSNLLKPEILGELALPEFEKNFQEAWRNIRVRIPPDNHGVLMQHGLGVLEGKTQTCYVLDFDFYADQKTGVRDAEPILDKFHRRAGRAFRWCIKPILHDALGPKPLDDSEDYYARHVG